MRHATLGCLLLLAGCRYQPTPIPIQGDPVAIAAMAGQWNGEYWSNVNARRGVLAFTLKSGADSIYGDVTMLTPLGQPIVSSDPAESHRLHATRPQDLRVDFVRVDARTVRGALESYMSPECQCAVTTVFTGSLMADTLRGTFITRSRDSEVQRGFWEMFRRAR